MDNLVKGVQCYELFGGIALKIHTFSFFIFIYWNGGVRKYTFIELKINFPKTKNHYSTNIA